MEYLAHIEGERRQSVKDHLYGTAELAGNFAERFGKREWGYCCGMLHDIGKPISDVAVSSRDGSTTWNPYVESLQAWVQRNNLDRYFLRWKKQRHNRHTTVGVSAIKFIIPETTSSFIFLGESGIEIIEAMHEAISGFTVSKVVSRVVIDADKTSVMHDLRQSNIEITEFNCGVPVERYCLDAMRRLI